MQTRSREKGINDWSHPTLVWNRQLYYNDLVQAMDDLPEKWARHT